MRAFPELPNDVALIIFNDDTLNAAELSQARLVSKQWNKLISEESLPRKLEPVVQNLCEQLKDPSAPTSLTLAQLKKMVALPKLTDELNNKLFIALKQFESNVIAITANPILSHKKNQQLQISWDELQNFLFDKYGIAGLFYSRIIGCAFRDNGLEVRAQAVAIFLALEFVLKKAQDPIALPLINRLVAEKILEIDKPLEFEQNSLYIVPAVGNKISLTFLINEILESQNEYSGKRFNTMLQTETTKILDRLEAKRDKSQDQTLLQYLTGYHQRACKIDDEHERLIAFYEFKNFMLNKWEQEQLPQHFKQEFAQLEYSGYVEFYNNLREQHGFQPVHEPRSSGCLVM